MSPTPEELRESIAELSRAQAVSPEELHAAEAAIATLGVLDVPPPLVLEDAQSLATVTPPPSAPSPSKARSSGSDDESNRDIRAQIAEMEMPQKIKLALFGNAICRTLLILDGSRMIQRFVLKNPKLTAQEVETFARNPNISDFVLRVIADSKTWMKTYSVKVSIVSNPRTPGDVALRWMRFLQEQDLRRLAKSKSVSQLVSTTAKKRLADMDKG